MWDDRTERLKPYWDAEDIGKLSKLPIVEGAVGIGTVLSVHFNSVEDQNGMDTSYARVLMTAWR